MVLKCVLAFFLCWVIDVWNWFKKCDRTAAGKEDQLGSYCCHDEWVEALKKNDGEEGEGTTSFFKNKWKQMYFWVLKEKIMRKALSIHDKMTLVLWKVSSSIMDGLINMFKRNIFNKVLSYTPFFYFNINFGELRGLFLLGGNHEKSLIHPWTKWH